MFGLIDGVSRVEPQRVSQMLARFRSPCSDFQIHGNQSSQKFLERIGCFASDLLSVLFPWLFVPPFCFRGLDVVFQG